MYVYHILKIHFFHWLLWVFEWIHLNVFSWNLFDSWMCRFMSFIKFWKFLDPISLDNYYLFSRNIFGDRRNSWSVLLSYIPMDHYLSCWFCYLIKIFSFFVFEQFEHFLLFRCLFLCDSTWSSLSFINRWINILQLIS